MVTIKSYTDIKQSKKLAEILPIESADMCYILHASSDNQDWRFNNDLPPMVLSKTPINKLTVKALPCWSLAALLYVLPNILSTGEEVQNTYEIDIRKHDGEDGTTLYQVAYGNNRGLSSSWHDRINTGERDSLIDACYEMILKLHSKNPI